jgi:hypothetical protein
MKCHPLLPALVAGLVLAGCGSPTDEGEEAAAPADRAPGVLLESARRPLERAGEAEDLAAGRKDALDAQIEGGEDVERAR